MDGGFRNSNALTNQLSCVCFAREASCHMDKPILFFSEWISPYLLKGAPRPPLGGLRPRAAPASCYRKYYCFSTVSHCSINRKRLRLLLAVSCVRGSRTELGFSGFLRLQTVPNSSEQ